MESNIGENIKEARRAKGLTQRELGRKIGKQYSTVQKYENGVIEPPISVIREIAAALECDPYSLMSFDQASDALSDRINARDRVNTALDQMNEMGMAKVADYAEDILSRYRATPAQKAAEARPAVREDKGYHPRRKAA